ncbi:metal-dependent transcriptional regulator [Corynebacterium uberis]|uniref:metal-dependent transcriptional regulator n=1 Tax=Corynebacterium TaxID=1716 RepID=UPI001D0AC09E|nr:MULTISPECIES: metal-dependent transcriptional regulator [Corynebacterium]MCZ9308729.1 metal-dependent transcriptional regulator [Corynebacterium sp. c6VSa_13]UDL72740.1 metal-dependent transcriptional regulator [Corynebacterium uberis]UDL76384.1 metal-dependent transcriptional regulator [Corynebacterium uberis]UDL78596.1 metal-dependent transcriptional regulator [Corynebacterium uberis]UDL80876.1 metal-dependent transcriptional regulator [Corynebacterium uberis]
MPVSRASELSASSQNYLKAVWLLQEWSGDPVSKTALAQRVGVKISAASDAVRKLTDQGLLLDTRYGAIDLTPAGRAVAVEMVRRHRLIETFLVTTLDYRWDQVHQEAEALEHAVSDFMVDRMDAVLGHPTRDPHGDPIPQPDGTTSKPDAIPLTTLSPGQQGRVERISDQNSELLQYCAGHGITIGAIVAVELGTPFSETLGVFVPGSTRPVQLGTGATDAIWVTPLPE